MRVFVSHATEDKPIALQLARLPDFVKPWVDVRELLGGQELDPTISGAIDESHVFIVLVSHRSVAKAWVAKEVEWALERESEKERVFVLPVLISDGLDLSTCPGVFARLADRLYLHAIDHSEAGLETARERVVSTLFHWASNWIEEQEPRGDSNGRFVDSLEHALTEFQTSLHALRAILAWPLPVLALRESRQHLLRAREHYGDVTAALMPNLVDMDEEVRRRFGSAAQRAFAQLSTFLRNDVFHGAAYALNDIVESLNSYESILEGDDSRLNAAERRRVQRVEELEPVMKDLTRRTADFVSMLR